jgi:hypothetical protein
MTSPVQQEKQAEPKRSRKPWLLIGAIVVVGVVAISWPLLGGWLKHMMDGLMRLHGQLMK